MKIYQIQNSYQNKNLNTKFTANPSSHFNAEEVTIAKGFKISLVSSLNVINKTIKDLTEKLAKTSSQIKQAQLKLQIQDLERRKTNMENTIQSIIAQIGL